MDGIQLLQRLQESQNALLDALNNLPVGGECAEYIGQVIAVNRAVIADAKRVSDTP